MKILTIAFIIAMVNYLPTGQSTLSLTDYNNLKDNAEAYTDELQLLYFESITGANEMLSKELLIYGDGCILTNDYHSSKEGDEYKLYSISDEMDISHFINALTDLALFDYESDVCYLNDGIGDITQSYYIYLLAGDKHYTLSFSDLVNRNPSWFTIVEYIRSIMDEYMIEEYEVDGAEYLDALDSQLEIYGVHPRFTGYGVRKYVEELEGEE